MLTALVVDEATASRHRVATLLQLAGWQVYEATDPAAALRAAGRIGPDLVVTELHMRSGSGLALLRQLRRAGSRARFLLMTARPSAKVEAQVAAAGVRSLAKPVDPRELVDFLRSRTPGPARQDTRPRVRITAERLDGAIPAPHFQEDDVPSWQDRQQEFFLSALPHHLARITHSAKAGDASAVADAAQTLASESRRHGRAEVATVCGSIVADARRGVLSQPRLMQLVWLASLAETH